LAVRKLWNYLCLHKCRQNILNDITVFQTLFCFKIDMWLRREKVSHKPKYVFILKDILRSILGIWYPISGIWFETSLFTLWKDTFSDSHEFEINIYFQWVMMYVMLYTYKYIYIIQLSCFKTQCRSCSRKLSLVNGKMLFGHIQEKSKRYGKSVGRVQHLKGVKRKLIVNMN
jgi:hypothetical protein